VAGESCRTANGSSITGLAFYKGGPYPEKYDDALFFADHSRRCIWVMKKGTNGLSNPGQLKPFVADAENPVDLEIGSGVSRCLLAPYNVSLSSPEPPDQSGHYSAGAVCRLSKPHC
jgi:hypothetical protein